MRRVAWWAIAVLCPALALGGCRSTQDRARQDLARELEARRASSERSMQQYRRGRAAFESGDMAAAEKHLTAAVSDDDRNLFAWMTLGAVQLDRRQLHEAAESFRQASRLAPQRYEPHYNLGVVLEAAGRDEAAIEAYEAALRLEPHQLEVLENLARTWLRAGRPPDRARALLEEALRREQRPQWTRWIREQMLMLDGQAGKPPF